MRALLARLIAREIVAVFGDEFLRRLLRGLLEIAERACFRRGQDQRPGLDADDMVGRQHAGASIARQFLAVDEVQDCLARAEFNDLPPMRALAAGIAQGAGPAQDRRHLAGAREIVGQRGRGEHRLAAPGEPLLGQRHQFDHALVGLARLVAEGEDAVLVEDQALDFWVSLEHVGRFLGEAEARHEIGHEAEPAVIDLVAQALRVRLVDQAQHRGGVAVVDEFRRHEGVQQHFDRRRRRQRVYEKSALRARHVVVRHGLARAQFA